MKKNRRSGLFFLFALFLLHCAVGEIFGVENPPPGKAARCDLEIPLGKTHPFQFVKIPPGKFLMGDNQTDPYSESPAHWVEITRPFYLSVYEVTQGQYMHLDMEVFHSEFRDDPRKPIQGVSWLDAITYCNRLSERTGHQPFFKTHPNGGMYFDFQADGFRLPTEAEWEYACRAGTKEAHFWGPAVSQDDFFLGDNASTESLALMNSPRVGKKGNYRSGENRWGDDFSWDQEKMAHFFGNKEDQKISPSERGPQPVGLLKPNPWGLYDMLGNVHEWCLDTFHYENGEFAYSEKELRDPLFVAPYSVIFHPACKAFHSRYEDGVEKSFVGSDHDGVFPEPGSVIRGGGWNSFRFECRCSERQLTRLSGGRATSWIGFRVVKNIPQPKGEW